LPDVVLFASPGLGSDRPAAAPATARKPSNVDLTEFGRINVMLGKPAVERYGMQRLDVHHGRDELLANQQIDEGTKMLRDRASGVAHERDGASE